ncbi:MAG: HAMP domain-containing histidine kinase [Chloroflexota bacterium]|nr:HAMP domain-containing histidine kinase [Chloroflexota bacterium]
MVGPELGASVATLGASAEVLIEDLDRLDARTIGCQAAVIRCRALRLQAYVENLLCAATIRQGRFRVQPRPLNLAEAAAEVRAVVGPLLAEKAQRLRLSARGALPNVLADGLRIGQVLVNLVGNAIRFSDPGTPIDVTIAARGDRVRVTVSDRGPGLPAGTTGALFEPSRRAAPAAGGDPQRIGLGLPVVKHIVEAHGGRVGAGPRPGGGARVWFELPVATPHVSAWAAGRSPRPKSRRMLAPGTR